MIFFPDREPQPPISPDITLADHAANAVFGLALSSSREVVRRVLAALSADGPVIVIDGNVADLDAAVRKLTDAAWSEFPVEPPARFKDRNHNAWFNDLVDAAREVAE